MTKDVKTGEDKTVKKTISRDDLATIISEQVQDAIPDALQSALGPLKQQQTDWMDQLRSETSRQSLVDEKNKGIGAARFVRALAFGRGDPEKAVHFSKKAWDDSLGEAVIKSLQAGDFTAGGFMIPPEFAAGIIELLRARTIVRAAGARILPMNSGTLTLRKQTGASTATYVGESQNITKTEPTGGQIVMTAKKLAAIVPISNDLLTFQSGPSADEFVRDDLVMQIAIREDQAFIRDDGLSDTPKGLRYWALAANITATNGTTATQVELDCKELIDALESANVRMIAPVWLMAPRSKNHLINLRDANGNLIFPEIRGSAPSLYSYPVFTTTNIPTNLSTNQSEVYLVDMADVIIGEASGLEIAVDTSASYVESGSLVSAFSRDETLMRAITRHDFAVRHEESIAIKTGVTWGA